MPIMQINSEFSNIQPNDSWISVICCQNSNKKYERGKINDVMGGGRKNLNFSNEITEILAAQNSYPGEVLGEVPEREKPIVATKLPKL